MSGERFIQPESRLTIVSRNERWEGKCATEPFECGWAREAVIFVRASAAHRMPESPFAHVQISPDGMWWVEEGTTLSLPRRMGELVFARVSHFGGWLRLAAELPEGASLTVLVSLHLKA